MTIQIPNYLTYDKQIYAIEDKLKGIGFFNPREFGIEPVALSSACWRGYICEYTIENGFLQLIDFKVGLSYLERIKIKYGKAKDLLGCPPKLLCQDDFYSSNCCHYEGIDYRVNFTGKMSILEPKKYSIRFTLKYMLGNTSERSDDRAYEIHFDRGNVTNIIAIGDDRNNN